jgi:putative phosphoribosyl transferase
MRTRPFVDRVEGGCTLGSELVQAIAGEKDIIVLGLPRGGVPVAAEVARFLHAPVDVLIVRKLGAPGNPELAIGAIASGGVVVRNEDVLRWIDDPDRAIRDAMAREEPELARREKEYSAGRARPDLSGRCVILVDDGIATGATMRAAVQAVRSLGAARVIVAAPSGARDSCHVLSKAADQCICCMMPEPYMAVGAWYEHFPQVSDAEVGTILRAAHAASSTAHTTVESRTG